MTELKPCPCCEGKAKYFIDTMVYGSPDHIVYCTNCGLRVTGYNSKEEAMEAWNRRPNPWHTGTPTEDGWYQCFTNDKDIPYQSMKFKEGWWWDYLDMVEEKVRPEYVIAWQKIEPYKEKS